MKTITSFNRYYSEKGNFFEILTSKSFLKKVILLSIFGIIIILFELMFKFGWLVW